MPRNEGKPPVEAGRLLLTLAEAGAQLGICEKTIRGYVDSGELSHIAFGRGTMRRRRMIHPDDLRDFIDSQRSKGTACPSIGQRGATESPRRHSTTMTSSTGSDGFLALLAAERSQKPASSNSASRKKPRSPSQPKPALTLVK